MHSSIPPFLALVLIAGCAVALPPPPSTTHPANPHAAEAAAIDPAASLEHDSTTPDASAHSEPGRAPQNTAGMHHAH